MPAINMEAILKQKMYGIEMEPVPQDWEAIHERLHPKKRRRIIFWWWMPLAGAMLLGGGYYAIKKNGGTTQSVNSPDQQQNISSTTTAEQNTPETTTPPSAEAGSIPSAPEDHATEASAAGGGADASGAVPVSASRSGGKARAAGKPSKGGPASNKQMEATEKEEAMESLTASPEFEPSKPEAVTEAKTEEPAPSAKTEPAAAKTAEVKAPEQAIPNLSTHKNKGWYIGVYGGAGLNVMSEPGGLGKFPTPSPGTSGYTQTPGAMSNGIHYEAGVVIQKKYKKFEWSIGAGLQRNGWKQQYTVTRDSIQPDGTVFSSEQVATKQTHYEHAAVEFPLMIGYRISEKGANSLWLTAGINNAFTVYLKELSFKATGDYPGGVISDPLTSPINKYHPQLRFGLTYDHSAAKYHWQLSPFLQYSTRTVVESGERDIRMMHLGLQFRYYLRSLR